HNTEIYSLSLHDALPILPAKTPHSPMRSDGSIGLVIESVRQGQNLKDGLLWFCDNCNNKLHETYFPLSNIEQDFQPRFKAFYERDRKSTRLNSSHVKISY